MQLITVYQHKNKSEDIFTLKMESGTEGQYYVETAKCGMEHKIQKFQTFREAIVEWRTEAGLNQGRYQYL